MHYRGQFLKPFKRFIMWAMVLTLVLEGNLTTAAQEGQVSPPLSVIGAGIIVNTR